MICHVPNGDTVPEDNKRQKLYTLKSYSNTQFNKNHS